MPLEMLFKIEFKKDAMQKGKFAHDIPNNVKELKKITTWYLAVQSGDSSNAKGLPTAIDWVTSLTMQCLKANPSFIPDNMAMMILSKMPAFFETFNRENAE